ncbi:MAG: VIT domain-containing protein [bacterium]
MDDLQLVRPLPPPVLMVRRGPKSVPLQLTRVAVRAKILGHLAETEMTMVFYNPNQRAHEGDLYFPLPEGATISGYALDIRGRMVDGVVVGKERARQVFEKEVRKGIDPGLVEWTQGRNVQPRVFPIPARGTRTIRVSYVTEVLNTRAGAVYRLPLNLRKKGKSFSLHLEVIKAVAKPVVLGGGPAGLSFGAWRDSFVAKVKVQNVTLTKDLRVQLPHIERTPVRVERAPDGQVYFAIRDVVKRRAAGAVGAPRRIALYWDASLSREKVSHEKELQLLSSYLDQLRRPVSVQLVVFRNEAERPRLFRLPAQRSALLTALRQMTYDGGTQLGSVRPVPGRVDLVLFFSDGLSNFGVEKPPSLGAPVYAINGATTANHAFLRYLALRSGGAYLNLNRISVPAALSAIGAEVFSFLSAQVSGATVRGVYPKVRAPVHGFFTLAGRLTGDTGQVTVQYGVGRRVMHRRTFTVRRRDAVRGDLLRRNWAQKKLDDLMIFPTKNEAEITDLGKAHSLVTPGTSLLVLENLSQYIEHKIRPPASLPGMAQKYDAAMQQLAAQKQQKQASKLSHVLALWKQRVLWWNTKFRRTYHRPRPSPRRLSVHAHSPAPMESMLRSGRGGGRGMAMGRVMRSADSRAKKTAGVQATGPSITMKAWDPKTPYVAALKASPAAGRYAVYLAQRKQHGASPAFYLDCAHFFRRVKQPRLALRILSNLAELELENPALIRVLAHRLSQIAEYDLSVNMFEKALKLRREEPQSFRDLALVLERRGDRERRRPAGRGSARADYVRAMALLSKVVMNKWDRFNEIEVIALTELNNILPKARRLGARALPVDKRLIKHLTVDIRIVMSWDADLTDMDLHVVEPTGEEAYYGHNRTEIGGMVTRDFTQGYGPEVYLIRRAVRGRYTIKTKFYGSSAAKLIGAVTLQVDVYTNFGRPNQRRRSMTLRLTKRKDTFTVGTIGF